LLCVHRAKQRLMPENENPSRASAKVSREEKHQKLKTLQDRCRFLIRFCVGETNVVIYRFHS
jgi:hypothetical protein